jgi:hypothetical protein
MVFLFWSRPLASGAPVCRDMAEFKGKRSSFIPYSDTSPINAALLYLYFVDKRFLNPYDTSGAEEALKRERSGEREDEQVGKLDFGDATLINYPTLINYLGIRSPIHPLGSGV